MIWSKRNDDGALSSYTNRHLFIGAVDMSTDFKALGNFNAGSCKPLLVEAIAEENGGAA